MIFLLPQKTLFLWKSIPNQEVSSEAAPGFVRDLGVPPNKVKFTFRAPESIKIGGSHSIQCISKPSIGVDLLIRMPKVCFHENDYLNYQYHAKRCLYLRVIERSLRRSPVVWDIKWSIFQDEARKPILIMYPVTEITGFFIRIMPTATSLFEVRKLNLTRNNSSILEDMFLEDNMEFVREFFLKWNTLKEALVLLKIWARHRSSIYAHDCLNGYLISVLVSYLATETGVTEITGFFIRIMPTATSLFEVCKLNLTRNNVRSLNQGSISSKATPKYNSSILEDMFLEDNMEFVREIFLKWNTLKEALVLLKIWARHTSSIYAHDCLNGYLISVLVSYLATETGDLGST